jgi:hypothetical protein
MEQERLRTTVLKDICYQMCFFFFFISDSNKKNFHAWVERVDRSKLVGMNVEKQVADKLKWQSTSVWIWNKTNPGMISRYRYCLE